MSSSGYSITEEQREILKQIFDVVVVPGRQVNECASLLATALGTFIRNVEPVGQHIVINQVIAYLNGLRPPLFDSECCSDCKDGNEVIEAVTDKLTHVDPAAAARALAKLLCIIVDSVGDEELAGDISEEIIDTLIPERSYH